MDFISIGLTMDLKPSNPTQWDKMKCKWIHQTCSLNSFIRVFHAVETNTALTRFMLVFALFWQSPVHPFLWLHGSVTIEQLKASQMMRINLLLTPFKSYRSLQKRQAESKSTKTNVSSGAKNTSHANITIRELSPVNLQRGRGGVWGEEGVGFHQGILID